jgi:hypothetical protein
VRFPSGTEIEIDGTRTVRGTGEAGIYTFLAQDTVISMASLNPSPSESRLARLQRGDLADRVGAEVTRVDRPGSWDGAVFRARQGPELWWPFLIGVVLLLAIEALMATSGEHQPRVARSAGRARGAHGVD